MSQDMSVVPRPRSAIVVEDLGLIEYDVAWKMQDEYAREIAKRQRAPTFLLLEHPHVYTFGRRGHAENLLWGEEQLMQKGIAVHWVDRGGDVTYHGPGQLVGYPLLALVPLKPGWPAANSSDLEADAVKAVRSDYVGYIRKLEKTLILALMRLGIAAGQRPGLTGVWVQADIYSRCPRCKPEDREKPAKIAAIGVKVDAYGVSRHGFALNVNPEMDYWDGIVACGLSEPVVSLADLLSPAPSMQKVKEEVLSAFMEIFEYQLA